LAQISFIVSERFPKTDKIRKRKEYQGVWKNGVRSYTRNFVIIKTGNEADKARLGISVSRKTGGAVQRNRIKRLIRECFRLYKNRMVDARDIVIITKKGISHSLTYGDVCRELESHFLAPARDKQSL
jgi:ribonuclease P protein component